MTSAQPIEKTVHANGIDFAYLEWGQGPLLLCLHGFPDTAHSWDDTAPMFAEAGFRVVAPYMRGYAPTSTPADGDVSVLSLAKDVLALIDVLTSEEYGGDGSGKAYVQGHDWGCYAAYTAANLAPEKVTKLIASSVPHMHKPSLTMKQMKKSWYVFFFQLPKLPEKRVSKDNYAFIDRLYAAWCPYWDERIEAAVDVKRALAAPNGLQSAIGYYRSFISHPSKEQREVMARVTTVPTLLFQGEADGSVDSRQHIHANKCYSQLDELVMMPRVGHFPHRERPVEYAQRVVRFLEK
jgi:pimeloyl-ACP methyl ester carboxylesterase